MKLTTSLLVSFLTLIASPTSLAAPIEPRDVYAPPVLYPHAGTVWTIGQRQNVTWLVMRFFVNLAEDIYKVLCDRDASDPPALISNRASVSLVSGGLLLMTGPGSVGKLYQITHCIALHVD